MADLEVLSTIRLEAQAQSHDVPAMGVWHRRVVEATEKLIAEITPQAAVAVTGFSEALAPTLRRGQLVVATELRTTAGSSARALPTGEVVANDLARRGLDVIAGQVVSTPRCPSGEVREALVRQGALGIDSDSFFVSQALGHRPLVVVRVIAGGPCCGPLSGGIRAMSSLLAARWSLERWAGALRSRTVLLATPRSFCAGVERAIATVERALERFGAPVYVRRQIVHNGHVVRALEAKGAVFVQELDEVPPCACVVLAAHGVSATVRDEASQRGDLLVIDATCPLVSKVHKEVVRFTSQDYSVVLIGHANHEEVVGTMGEAPGKIYLVESLEDVDALELEPGARVAYLTQTTLATDETASIVSALRSRFSHLTGPPGEDICYATQNRQDALRVLVEHCDLLLVIGSSNSSNSNRLVEVARREGCRAELVEDETVINLGWLEDAEVVGITAGASAPESLVQRAVSTLQLLGPVEVREVQTADEAVSFALPRQLR